MKHPLFKNANAQEELARLGKRVENRATGVGADATTIFEDVQLEHTSRDDAGCIFVTAQVVKNGTDLVFIAERVIYNPATEDNVPLGTETFGANVFSEWFATKRREGWRICQ